MTNALNTALVQSKVSSVSAKKKDGHATNSSILVSVSAMIAFATMMQVKKNGPSQVQTSLDRELSLRKDYQFPIHLPCSLAITM